MFFVMVKICEKEILMDLINLLRKEKKEVAVYRGTIELIIFLKTSTVTHSDFQIIRSNWGPEKNLLNKVKVERKRRIERGKKKEK